MRTTKWNARWITFLMLMTIFMSVVAGCGSTPAEQGQGQGSTDGQKPAEAGKNAGAAGTPKSGGTITVAMAEEPDTLDPQSTTMLASESITAYMGGGLLFSDPQTQEKKPYLAESYTVSEDGKTWTFKIRSGITFHDGTPVTAKTFKETFDRALSPEFILKSAGASLSSIKSITAPDDKTLIFELKEPSAPLLASLADQGFAQPLSLDAIKKSGAQYGRNPVGVGAWKFESWKPGESISLVRNDDFHWADSASENQGPVKPDKLVLKFISNSQTMLAALESGSIDIATSVPAKDAKKYKNNDKFTTLAQLKSGLGFYIEPNLRKPLFQDINVRKAINMAINKEAIVQSVLQGEGVVADGPLADSNFGYDKSIKEYAYKFNQEEAKKLLESSGWKLNGQGIREKDGKTLSIRLNSMERFSQPAQLVQGMLKDIGIEMKIENLEVGALIQAAESGDFDMTAMGFAADDPDLLYQFMHSSQIGGSNHSAINDKQLDALLEKGRTTVNNEERLKVYADVQKLVVEQAYWVPIYIEKKFIIINKRVQGVKLHPLGLLLFQDSWVNE